MTYTQTPTGSAAENFGASHSRGVSVSAIVGLIAATALLPVIVVPVLILAVVATYRRSPRLVGPLTVVLLTAVLAWVNAGKEISGDWTWYVTHYRILEYTPLSDYLGTQIGWIIPERTEPLYYSIASILSVATGANVVALSIAVSFITYGAIGAAIVFAVTSATQRLPLIAFATASAMLMGLTFTLTTQLVRQEMAAAFIGLGLVLLAKHKVWLTVVFSVAAVLTHNSAIIPAAGVAVAFLIGRGHRFRTIRWIVIGALFYGLGRFYLATSGDAVYSTQNDGSISPAIIALDVAVALVFATVVSRTTIGRSRIAAFVLMCVPSFYGFVLGVASQPLPLLRMYFYIEVLRALMIAFICIWLMRSRAGALVGVLLLIVAVAYAQLRINQSPFVYDISLVDALFSSPLLGR